MSKGLTNGCSSGADSGGITGVVTPTNVVDIISISPEGLTLNEIDSISIWATTDFYASYSNVGIFQTGAYRDSNDRNLWRGSVCAKEGNALYSGAGIYVATSSDGMISYGCGQAFQWGAFVTTIRKAQTYFHPQPYRYTITPSAIFS
nr:MAG TPA_asm: hypothetical protein [Caudoviricetes sp.]